jgi:1-acyl-sn-glycerol-3-phosphate acyltransferase
MIGDTRRFASDRYLEIMASSRIPVLGLVYATIMEDKRLLLPRALRASFATALRIPRSLLIAEGPMMERYVFETLQRWAKKLCRICQVRLEVSGSSFLREGKTYLFVANHQSPADILALYAALPVRAGFVSTSIMARIPVFAYWMRKSGAIFVDQGDRKGELSALRAMVRGLERGRSLVLFPEGHMYQGEGLAEFNRGGICAASIARVPIVPVYIGGTSEVLRTGSFHISPRKRVTVEFGEPIDFRNLRREELRNINVRVRDRIAAMKEKGQNRRSA